MAATCLDALHTGIQRARYRSRTIRTSAFDKVFRAREILLANRIRPGMPLGWARKNLASTAIRVRCRWISNKTLGGAGNGWVGVSVMTRSASSGIP